ncbi:MAG: TonB-dependent receptor [Gammaproteobacteria bacterium]|nr:TonB-dependent receptor [Gammaproteobacteria bacterium]
MNRKRLAAAITFAVVASPLSGLSWAQQAGNNEGLEEIIVTAQKREQSLQKVPVSITALTGVELENKGVTSLIELEKSSPNTQLRASRATNSTLTAYIRGVGQQDPLWGFEPGVGVYVDDVYYARPQAAVIDVFDVERIEILRGPQGTLYGKNTVGGAIKYVTKKMSGEANAKVTVSTGAYDQQEFTLAGQMPIIENQLYIGGAVSKMDRDGYGKVLTGYDIDTGLFSSSVDNYNKDVLVGRVSVEYTPTEQLFFRFSADKTDDDSNQLCGTQSNQTGVINPGTSELFMASGDPYDSACGTTHRSNVENQGFSLTAQYDVNEQLSFKYIYADREGETQQFIDFEGTPLDIFDVPAKYSDEQQSHELQVNYTADRFALVGGLYYFKGNSAGAFDVVLNSADPFSGTHFDLAIGGDVDTVSESAYLNGSFNITDTLTFTAGVRITKDDKNSNIQRISYMTANSFPYTTTQGSGFTFGDPADDILVSISTDIGDDEAREDWSEVSPSAKLDWQINDDIMVYISYAEGFKSGGFDMRGNAALNPNVAKGYDPEIVDTWEAGIKSQLLNDRLRLNFAVFDMDYTDMQLTVQVAQPAPVFFSSDVVNAGTAEIKGAELEAIAQFTNEFSSSLSVGYMNAELTEVISAGVDVSDSWEMLNAPEWTAQLGFNYKVDLDTAGSLALNTAASYRGASRNFNNVLCSCDQNESYILWDASANWYSSDEHWTVSLYLKNLQDREYKTGGYNLGSGELAFYGAPRTWTATVAYQF